MKKPKKFTGFSVCASGKSGAIVTFFKDGRRQYKRRLNCGDVYGLATMLLSLKPIKELDGIEKILKAQSKLKNQYVLGRWRKRKKSK